MVEGATTCPLLAVVVEPSDAEGLGANGTGPIERDRSSTPPACEARFLSMARKSSPKSCSYKIFGQNLEVWTLYSLEHASDFWARLGIKPNNNVISMITR